MTAKEDIIWLKNELLEYSFDFRSIYQNFTSDPPSKFSERYQNFISNATQILIYTLINGKETTLLLPFSAAVNRIPNTVVYIWHNSTCTYCYLLGDLYNPCLF